MNIKQHKFVTEYLRMGDKIVAYHNAYPNPKRKDRATESAANRLMQHPEVLKAITDAQETCMYRAMEDLKDKMKEELLTVYQKRLLCKHVVLGEVREEVVFKGKGCAHCSYFREIPYSVKLRYSKEDSLLAGHYPDKRANKHNKMQQPNEVSSTSQPDNQNQRVISQQNEETPHLFLGLSRKHSGRDIGRKAEGFNLPIGEVDSGVMVDPHQTKSRNISQQPDNTSPPRRGVGVGSLAMDNDNTEHHNTSQQNICPPPAGVAKDEPGVDTREEHSPETNQTQEFHNISQQPDNTSPLGRGVGAASASGVMVDSRNTNETPEKEPQRLSVSAVKQPHTVSHAGLRKLFNKQRIKKQQPLIFTPCA